MIIRICDRCKKTIEEGYFINSLSTQYMSRFFLETGPFEKVDSNNDSLPGKVIVSKGKKYSGELCQKCTNELISWFEEKSDEERIYYNS